MASPRSETWLMGDVETGVDEGDWLMCEEDEEDDAWCGTRREKPIVEENVYGMLAINCAYIGRNKVSQFFRVIWTCVLMSTVLYVQFLFTVRMIPSISQNEWSKKTRVALGNSSVVDNLFLNWRVNADEGDKLIPTGVGDQEQPWAWWICHGIDFSWQESVVENLNEYAKAEPLLFGSCRLPAGLIFGVFASIIWASTVLTALRQCASYAMLILVDQDPGPLWQWRNPLVKCAVFISVLARSILTISLGFYGLDFLVYTDNLKDFILNCVALGFVFDIPQLIYFALATNILKSKVRRSRKLIPAVQVHAFWGYASGLMSFLIISILVGYGLFKLVPFSRTLQKEVLLKLCSNNVFWLQVNTTNGTPVERPLTSNQMFQ